MALASLVVMQARKTTFYVTELGKEVPNRQFQVWEIEDLYAKSQYSGEFCNCNPN